MKRNLYLLTVISFCLLCISCGSDEKPNSIRVRLAEGLDQRFHYFLANSGQKYSIDGGAFVVPTQGSSERAAAMLSADFITHIGVLPKDMTYHFDGTTLMCCLIESHELAFLDLFYGENFIRKLTLFVEENIYTHPLEFSCADCSVTVSAEGRSLVIHYSGKKTLQDSQRIRRMLGVSEGSPKENLGGLVSGHFSMPGRSGSLAKDYYLRHTDVRFSD